MPSARPRATPTTPSARSRASPIRRAGPPTYAYDAKGNMTSLTDPTGATTTYAYDAKGNVTKVTNPLGQATTFTYDAKGNLASVTDPAGAATSYTYDAAGNVISITDAKGAVTQFVYDVRNRLIKAIDPQGNVTALQLRRQRQQDSPRPTPTATQPRFEYNCTGPAHQDIDALGSVTTYAYGGTACPSCGGGTDKLTAITDANGNITELHLRSTRPARERNRPAGQRALPMPTTPGTIRCRRPMPTATRSTTATTPTAGC